MRMFVSSSVLGMCIVCLLIVVRSIVCLLSFCMILWSVLFGFLIMIFLLIFID